MAYKLIRIWPFLTVALRIRTGLLTAIFRQIVQCGVTLGVACATLVLVPVAEQWIPPFWVFVPVVLEVFALGVFLAAVRFRASNSVSFFRTHIWVLVFEVFAATMFFVRIVFWPTMSWWLVFVSIWILEAVAIAFWAALVSYVCVASLPRKERVYFLLLYSSFLLGVLLPLITASIFVVRALSARDKIQANPGAADDVRTFFHIAFACIYLCYLSICIIFVRATRAARLARRRRQLELAEAQLRLAQSLTNRTNRLNQSRDRRYSSHSAHSSAHRSQQQRRRRSARSNRVSAQRPSRSSPPPLPEVNIYEDDATFAKTTLETCVICFDNAANTVLQECGHNAFCIECARRVRTCPLCRANIAGIVVRFPESARGMTSSQTNRAALEAAIRLEHQLHRLAYENGPINPSPTSARSTRSNRTRGGNSAAPSATSSIGDILGNPQVNNHHSRGLSMGMTLPSHLGSPGATLTPSSNLRVMNSEPELTAAAHLGSTPPWLVWLDLGLANASHSSSDEEAPQRSNPTHQVSITRVRGLSSRSFLSELASNTREFRDAETSFTSFNAFIQSIPLPSSMLPSPSSHTRQNSFHMGGADWSPAGMDDTPVVLSHVEEDVSLGVSSTSSSDSHSSSDSFPELSSASRARMGSAHPSNAEPVGAGRTSSHASSSSHSDTGSSLIGNIFEDAHLKHMTLK